MCVAVQYDEDVLWLMRLKGTKQSGDVFNNLNITISDVMKHVDVHLYKIWYQLVFNYK